MQFWTWNGSTDAERARITSGGNFGIANTDPNYNLSVGTPGTTANSYIQLGSTTTGTGSLFFGDTTGTGSGSFRGYVQYDHNLDALIFGSAATNQARITSGGELRVGTTSSSYGAALAKMDVNGGSTAGMVVTTSGGATHGNIYAHNTATSGNNVFVDFGTEGTWTTRGSITYNRGGGLVAYNTTSDYRAKNIIGPVTNPGATIDALKVYEGQMNGATQSRPMLIAHEAQEYAPYAVSGVKDEVNEDGTPKYQQMDVSALVPLLLAEIQSLRARVAQLETK